MGDNSSEVFELLQETNNLYEFIIEQERKVRNDFAKRKINYKSSRISFEFLDLTTIYERLIDFVVKVHKNYSQLFGRGGLLSGDSLITKKILKVYLAGICSMIKLDFYHGTTTTFKRITGIQDLNNYYKLLECAFQNEGIIPSDWNSKKPHRFKDVLISEAGIPTDLVSNIIKFFKIYWKYFKGSSYDIKQNFITNMKCENNFLYKFQYDDLRKMQLLYEKIKEYPTKVLKVLSQLEEIYYYIEDNDFDESKFKEEEFYKKSSEELGYDILTVIPNKRVLVKLYKDMLNKVTLAKFKRILRNKPENAWVVLPTNKRKKIRDYSNYVYGKHKLLNVEYEVLPDTTLNLKDIFSYQLNKVLYIRKDHFIYLSDRSFNVWIGYERFNSYQIYYEGKRRYIWYGVIPRGRVIKVDNELIIPKEEISWDININCNWDYKEKRYKLFIYIPFIRVYNQKYKNKKISIRCSVSSYVVRGFFNKDGYFAQEFIVFDLDKLEYQRSIDIDVLVDDEIIVSKNLKLQDIYLFDKLTKKYFIPGSSSTTSGELLLLINKELNYNPIGKNYYKYSRDFGYFNIYKIQLEQLYTPKLTIHNYTWSFSEIVKLYLKKIFNSSESLEYNSCNVVNEIALINMEIVTNIEEENMSEIFITVEKDNRVRQYSLDEITKRKKDKIIFCPEVIKTTLNCQNYIGDLIISIYYRGRKYHSVNYKVIPEIKYNTTKLSYKEGEKVEIELRSNLPCFYDRNDNLVSHKIVQIGQALLTEYNGVFKSCNIQEYITLSRFGVEKRITVKPKVWGIRIIDFNSDKYIMPTQLYITKIDDIDKYGLVIISEYDKNFKLIINDYEEVISIDDNMRIIKLSEYIQNFNEVTKVTVQNDYDDLSFNIIWDTVIRGPQYIQKNNILQIKFYLEGPSISNFNIILVSENDGIIERVPIESNNYFIEKILTIDLFTLRDDTIYVYINRIDNDEQKEFKIPLSKFRLNIVKEEAVTIQELLLSKLGLFDEFQDQDGHDIKNIETLYKYIKKFIYLADRFSEQELLLWGDDFDK